MKPDLSAPGGLRAHPATWLCASCDVSKEQSIHQPQKYLGHLYICMYVCMYVCMCAVHAPPRLLVLRSYARTPTWSDYKRAVKMPIMHIMISKTIEAPSNTRHTPRCHATSTDNSRVRVWVRDGALTTRI